MGPVATLLPLPHRRACLDEQVASPARDEEVSTPTRLLLHDLSKFLSSNSPSNNPASAGSRNAIVDAYHIFATEAVFPRGRVNSFSGEPEAPLADGRAKPQATVFERAGSPRVRRRISSVNSSVRPSL